MSLYNILNGHNSACICLLPMLGRKAEEYPRFRDCFLSDDGKRIVIYTRVGGNNRGSGFGEEELYKDENFVTTYDDDFDNTYASYEFNVPKQWKKDFDAMLEHGTKAASDEYVQYVKEFYPSLAQTGIIDVFFGRVTEREARKCLKHI